MKIQISREIRLAVISLLVIGFLWWFFFWQPPPITYKEAYREAPAKIMEYCKHLNINPCDYKFAKFTGNKEGGTWVFYFESKYRPPIVVEFFSNGEANIYNFFFINQSLND